MGVEWGSTRVFEDVEGREAVGRELRDEFLAVQGPGVWRGGLNEGPARGGVFGL